MKYIRRLTANIVDAVQYSGIPEEVMNFCKHVVEDQDKLYLPIGEARITIEDGDFVLRDIEDGTYHVCDGVEFVRCYEVLAPLSITAGSYRELMKIVSRVPVLPQQTRIHIMLSKPQFDLLKHEIKEFSSIEIPESHPNIMKLTINQNKYIIFYE